MLLGEPHSLEAAMARAKAAIENEPELWLDCEMIEVSTLAIAESLFALQCEVVQDALVVIESETVAGALACAHELVEKHGLRAIEMRILRSSTGGAYGFFTGSKSECEPAALKARERLTQAQRSGRVEVIVDPGPDFRSFFGITGTR
jgi:hypothetical protein